MKMRRNKGSFIDDARTERSLAWWPPQCNCTWRVRYVLCACWRPRIEPRHVFIPEGTRQRAQFDTAYNQLFSSWNAFFTQINARFWLTNDHRLFFFRLTNSCWLYRTLKKPIFGMRAFCLIKPSGISRLIRLIATHNPAEAKSKTDLVLSPLQELGSWGLAAL